MEHIVNVPPKKSLSLGTGVIESSDSSDDRVTLLLPRSVISSAAVMIETSDSRPSTQEAVDSKDANTPPRFLGRESSLLNVAQEEAAVVQIVAALSESERKQLPDETMPIRHYRACKGNLNRAIAGLRYTLAWRQEFGVDRIMHAFDGNDTEMQAILTEENVTGKIYVRGHDRQGRALLYMRPGRENTHNQHHNMQHLVYNLERAIACTQRASAVLGHDPPLEKINLVIDYDAFSLSQAPPLSTSRYTLDILQNHYPERLHCAYVCHPPLIFRTFYAIVRPFIDPKTKEKICFCSGARGIAKLTQTVKDINTLEECAGGPPGAVPEFDYKDYLSGPFEHGFRTS